MGNSNTKLEEGKGYVVFNEDSSCEMADIYYSGTDMTPTEGMEGNYWDFHNDCHGFDDLPKFNNRHEFAEILAKKYNCEIVKGTYKYEY